MQLRDIVEDLAPGLFDRSGVGPVTLAQVVVSFSHPGRCRSDAASPPSRGPARSRPAVGAPVRHRLNRGGDRALNSAIHAVGLVRLRSCSTTPAYGPPTSSAYRRPRPVPCGPGDSGHRSGQRPGALERGARPHRVARRDRHLARLRAAHPGKHAPRGQRAREPAVVVVGDESGQVLAQRPRSGRCRSDVAAGAKRIEDRVRALLATTVDQHLPSHR
jgi:hypothetical protein